MPKKGLARYTEHVPLPVPSVWNESGYLVLLFKVRQDERHDEAYYFSMCNSALLKKQKRPPSVHVVPASTFERRMSRRRDDVCPHRYALSILTGLRSGIYEMRVKDERSIVAMLDQQQLVKMSERQLAEVYRKVMGSGPARIPSEEKEQRVAEILSKVQENAALATDIEESLADSNGEDAAEASASAEQAGEGETMNGLATSTNGSKRRGKAPVPKLSKKAAAPPKPKKAATKEKAAKATKTPKPAKEKVAKPAKEKALKPAKPKREGPAPIREGTMKAKALQIYQKGGEREKVLKAIEGLGATASTARGWYQSFKHRQ